MTDEHKAPHNESTDASEPTDAPSEPTDAPSEPTEEDASNGPKAEHEVAASEKTSRGPWLTAVLVLGVGAAIFAALNAGTSAPKDAEPKDAADPVAAASGLVGTVQEIIQVSSYTYLRAEHTAGDEFWAAVTKADLKEGQQVRVVNAQLMTDFRSRELDRTFDEIYFGQLAVPEVAGVDDGGEQLPPGHPPVASPDKGTERLQRALDAEAVEVAQVDKAEGEIGFTVAEIHAQREGLAGKTIRVRATVVKLTPGVMGTNFLHVRDRSGSPENQDHDLTLKVKDNPPAVGEVGLFEGVLANDVDLGSGYTFPVLVEEGKVLD